MNRIVLLCAVVVVSTWWPAAFTGRSSTDKPTFQPGQSDSGPYSFTEAMIPMRDGIRLQTEIIAPNSVHNPLPILLRRTPYGVPTKTFNAVPEGIKARRGRPYLRLPKHPEMRKKGAALDRGDKTRTPCSFFTRTNLPTN